jgi:hypothetical protein
VMQEERTISPMMQICGSPLIMLPGISADARQQSVTIVA